MSLDNLASAEVQIAGYKERWFPHDVEQVLVSSVVSDTRVKHTPQLIDIEPWSPWIRQMVRRTAEKGKEQWRPCFVDHRERVLNFPKPNFTPLTRVDYPEGFGGRRIINSAVRADWNHPSGDNRRFIPVGSFHTHPHDKLTPGSLSASDNDFQAFLGDGRQLFMGIVCDNRMIFFLKTASTPQTVDRETLGTRIKDTSTEFSTAGCSVPVSQEDRLRFNKQIALDFGLSVYMSERTTPMFLNKISLSE